MAIRYFKLQNKGAFVVRMKIEWTNIEDGNESHGVYEPSGYHDICAAAERTIDLKELKKNNGSPLLSEGAKVKLKAVVVAGKDKVSEEFTYSPSSGDTATFKITGTTLINTLTQI